MGLGVLPGRELELVCQLVKRGVGGGQNSRAFPGQAISKFPSHELSTFSDVLRETYNARMDTAYQFLSEPSRRRRRQPAPKPPSALPCRILMEGGKWKVPPAQRPALQKPPAPERTFGAFIREAFPGAPRKH